MRLSYLCLCSLSLFSATVYAQDTPVKSTKIKSEESVAKSNVPLPVKKVVLYKNGVGYFEHRGQVRGNEEFDIDFTTAQLHDVLKSLTLVDLNGGGINAVRYNSVAPLEEQLKGLQIPLSEDVTSATLLIALPGTRVEVHTGSITATGKIFSVETVEKETPSGGTNHVTQLGIVTDSGELRLFELTPSINVRSADPEIQKDL